MPLTTGPKILNLSSNDKVKNQSMNRLPILFIAFLLSAFARKRVGTERASPTVVNVR
jgi:hypothetical protein